MEQQMKTQNGWYLPAEDKTMCDECMSNLLAINADPSREKVTTWTVKTSICDYCDQAIFPTKPVHQ